MPNAKMFLSDEAAAAAKHKHAVKLTGDELERVRAACANIQKELDYVARMVMSKIGHKDAEKGLSALGKIIIKPPNRYLKIFYDKDGHCAGCWEDPPGICRPCNDPNSTDGHAE